MHSHLSPHAAALDPPNGASSWRSRTSEATLRTTLPRWVAGVRGHAHRSALLAGATAYSAAVAGFEDWTPVAAEADVPVGKATRVSVGGQDVFLFRMEERLFAMDNRCTHLSGPLHRGMVNARAAQPTVTCPVHGSTFWMQDGRVVRGPATRWQPVYEVRVTDGTVEVRSPPSAG